MNSTGRNLVWHHIGADWVLVAGRRRTGRVVPDAKYPNMWRSLLSGGRLSDMANLSWAKDSVLAAGERELEFGVQSTPQNAQKRGVFQRTQSHPCVKREGPLLPYLINHLIECWAHFCDRLGTPACSPPSRRSPVCQEYEEYKRQT
jgi:hypothetical protein